MPKSMGIATVITNENEIQAACYVKVAFRRTMLISMIILVSHNFLPLWQSNFSFAAVWGIWIKRNVRIFIEVERLSEEVCEEARFSNVSLRTLVNRLFYHYSLGLILLDWSPYL